MLVERDLQPAEVERLLSCLNHQRRHRGIDGRNPVPDIRERGRANPAHLGDLLDRREGAVCSSVIDDSLRKRRTDPPKGL